MGAHLILESLWDTPMPYPRPYVDAGDVMLAMGLSDIFRPMLDDSHHLAIDQANKLIDMIEDRSLLESAEHLQQEREDLLAILRKSIELNEPLACSSQSPFRTPVVGEHPPISELFRRDPEEHSPRDVAVMCAWYRKEMALRENVSKEIAEITEASRKKQRKRAPES